MNKDLGIGGVRTTAEIKKRFLFFLFLSINEREDLNIVKVGFLFYFYFFKIYEKQSNFNSLRLVTKLRRIPLSYKC